MRNLCASLLIGATALLSGCNTTPIDKATIYYNRAQFPVQVTHDFPDTQGPIL
ncbi:hypothetical protein [Pseudomonas chlororaphis]|uniref:hypothetical protein n=1 Tax=Pseudomonas chlororaphis TaxID=587753 RepID=UPI001E4218A5|nr:hypothetical protein [Pseudomonas chlororaphis]